MPAPLQILAAATVTPATLWPFAVLGICLAAIVFLVTVARVQAFFATILAGVMVEKLPGEYGTLPATPHKERSHWVQTAELTTKGFGNIAAKIGIALASVMGSRSRAS